MKTTNPGFKFLTLATIIMMLVLAACTNTPAPGTTATTTTTATATTTTTTTITKTITATAPTTATTTTPTTTATPTPSAGTAPPEITQYAKDWPLPNKDYANTRATTDSTINASNVNTLGVAWSVPIQGSGGFGSAAGVNPIIQGDSVYLQDLNLNVYSIDKATGKLNWFTPFNTSNIGPTGPGVAYGKVFVVTDNFNTAALDAKTGKVLWNQPISNTPLIGMDFQPVAYDNTVFTSSVPGSSNQSFYRGGAYGVLYGLEQQTGKIKWSWNTIDDPKTFWGHPEVNSGGGAWYPPAIDTKTGMTYWGIGNAGPLGGTKDFPNGTSRPGPNLYTASIVAVDHTTGKLQWFFQPQPHDINDYDLQTSPVLASANYNGKQQDIVIGAGKMGNVYAFNRQTGALLWQCAVGKHQNDLLIEHNPPEGQSIEVFPGIFGGVETPMAYADGVVYVATENLSTKYTATGIAGLMPFSEGTGNLTAIDVNIGRVLWDVTLPGNNFGGATIVNDLVFTATSDGTIYAFKRADGSKVWTYKAPAGINAYPAVSGDMIIWPCGSGGAPSLIALKLGAKAPIANIVRPSDGGTLPSGDITVVAAAFNISLVNKLGQANAAGEGHLHYFLDATPPTEPGKPAVTAPGTYAATADTTYTWKAVPAGKHTLSVELVQNDHTPMVPPVVYTVNITTQDNAPSVKITSPATQTTTQPGPVEVTVTLTNFTLTTGTGQPNQPNQGKIIFYMDSSVPLVPGQPGTNSTSITGASTSYTFQMTAGTHIFSVQLVNNDLTTLPIPAADSIVLSNGLAPVYSGP